MSNNHSTKENRLSQAESLPRSIPTVVLYQLDMLLEQAIKMMGNSQTPDILKPVYWDAILILRRTGMHFEDLIHLREPDNQGCNGCLEQDSGGYWWLHVHRKINKVDKIYRISLERHHRVVEAIYRQQERVKDIPYLSDENYLFRNRKGTVKYSSFRRALARDLSPHLIYDSQSYVITPLQFRHTIAMEMIQQGIDIYVVKEFLGYTSLKEMDKYVLCQPASSIRENLYRVKEIGFCTINHPLEPCPHKPFIYSDKQNEKMNFTIPVETLRRKLGAERTNQEQQEVEKEIDAIKQEGDEDGPPHDY